jgi:hypothetical protein
MKNIILLGNCMAYLDGGEAADHLSPSLREDAVNKYTTAASISILIRVIKAKRNFRALMTDRESLQDFLTNSWLEVSLHCNSTAEF